MQFVPTAPPSLSGNSLHQGPQAEVRGRLAMSVKELNAAGLLDRRACAGATHPSPALGT
jgi:hypothetical protein